MVSNPAITIIVQGRSAQKISTRPSADLNLPWSCSPGCNGDKSCLDGQSNKGIRLPLALYWQVRSKSGSPRDDQTAFQTSTNQMAPKRYTVEQCMLRLGGRIAVCRLKPGLNQPGLATYLNSAAHRRAPQYRRDIPSRCLAPRHGMEQD